MTVAEVEDKVGLPLTPQWGRKESDMTEPAELTVTLYYNFSSVNFSQGSLPLEKEMATNSNILAWRIPWTDHGVVKRRT